MATVSGIGSAASSRDEFLQLLVTQIQHQDPLEPVKQEDFLSQLAQFSTLEGIENLNSTLETYLQGQAAGTQELSTNLATFLGSQASQARTQNLILASDLIGQNVTYNKLEQVAVDGDLTSNVKSYHGRVEGVQLKNDTVKLIVNGEEVELAQLTNLDRMGSESAA
jgi:flagellar basal-body rod modification protein FlgD